MAESRRTCKVVILLVILACTLAANPGVKMRATKKAVSYVKTLADNAIREKIGTATFQDKSGEEGRLSYRLTNIRILNPIGPNTLITLDPATGGLRMTASNFGVNVNADWWLKYKVWFVPIRGSGSAEADISGASLSVAIGAGESNGLPTVSSRECSCQIEHVSVQFHGGLVAWVLNLFRGKVSGMLKDLLQTKVCEIVNEQINVKANEKLSKMKTHVNLGPLFLLDYSLISRPVVTANYLEVLSKGQVYWTADRRESQLSPADIPPWNDYSSMLNMWVTEYTINTFGDVAHRFGYLQYNITPITIPAGRFDPPTQIKKLHPNSRLEFHIGSSAPPTVKIDSKNLTVTASGDVEVVVHFDGNSAYLTLGVDVSVSVQPSISKDLVTATISDYSFNVRQKRSDFGPINAEELNALIKDNIDSVIIPALNDFGQRGAPLPVTGTVRMYNTKILTQQGYLQVNTDVEVL